MNFNELSKKSKVSEIEPWMGAGTSLAFAPPPSVRIETENDSVKEETINSAEEVIRNFTDEQKKMNSQVLQEFSSQVAPYQEKGKKKCPEKY